MNNMDRTTELNRLLSDLHNGDESARRYAAEDLGYGGFSEAAGDLARGLNDSSVAVAEACSAALAGLGGEEVAHLLVENLASEDVRLRNLSSEVLSQLGDSAVAALASQLTSLDRDVRKFAVDSLLMIRSEASKRALVVALDDSDVNVAATAADGLGEIGGQDHLEVLASYLGVEDEWMRCAVVRGITSIGGAKALKLVRPYLKDPSMVVKITCIQGVGKIQSLDAAKALVEVLEGEDPGFFASEIITALHAVVSGVNEEEIRTIAHEGTAKSLGSAIVESLKPVKLCAMELAGLLRLNSCLEALIGGLDFEDEELREQAKHSLTLLSQDDLSPYEVGLADPAKPTFAKEAMLGVVAVVFHEDAQPIFERMLASDSGELVAAGLKYLPVELGPVFKVVLEQKIADSQSIVRLACADAMGRVALEDFVASLVSQLNQEEETDVQEAIDTALIQIGSKNLDSGVRPYLQSFTAEERAIALGRYGFEKPLNYKENMIAALNDPHLNIRLISYKVLANLGQLTSEIIQRGLTDPEATIQIEAVRSIGTLNDRSEKLGVLQGQLRGGEPRFERVEVELIQQLVKLGGDEVSALIRPFLRSPSVWVKIEAVEALKSLGDRTVVEELKGLLEGAEDELLDVLEQAIYELE